MNRTRDSETLRLLREISPRGELSVSALARALGVKPSVVLSEARVLISKGLVSLRDGGKKIGLNPEYGYVVGIDLGGSHLHFALADFRGEILSDSTEKVRPEDGPRKMIGQIKEGIRRLAAAAGFGPSGREKKRGTPRLRALAMGVPSPVDPKRGLVAFANNLPGWKNIHLGLELEKEFRVPVFLENDANMAAIGEHWRGVARGADNFIFIALGTGIGSGIFADGKLYRGRSGWAGELFRMNVEWPRWEEDFGEVGYFESHVSGMGIAAEGRKALGPHSPQGSGDLAKERDALFVFEAFRQGSRDAQKVLEKIFTMLGVGVADIVAVLDPELIVLGGGVTKGAPELLIATVEKVLRRIHQDPPPVRLSALEDKAQTYGAIFSALTAAQEAVARRLA